MNNLFYIFSDFFFNYYVLIVSTFCSFSIFTFLFDGFKFSDIKLIRILQNITIIIILFSLVLSIMFFFKLNVIYSSDGSESEISKVVNHAIKEKNLTLNATVNLGTDSVKVLSDGLVSASSNIGLGASIGGVASAVSLVLKTSGIPPMAKVVLVTGGALAGAVAHTGATNLKRATAKNYYNNSPDASSSIVSGNSDEIIKNIKASSPNESDWLSNLLSDNPVESVFLSLYILNLVSLFLIILLAFFLISNYILKSSLMQGFELKILDKLIPLKYKDRVKNFILKIFTLYSKSNTVNIIITIILLFFCNITSNIFIYTIINNLVNICKNYLGL